MSNTRHYYVGRIRQLFDLFPRKSVGDLLTYAYIGAFSLIALLTYLAHIITDNIMEVQMETVEVSYYLGQQRSLVQQVSFHATNYYSYGEEVDLTFLQTALGQIKKSQQYLEYTISKPVFLDELLGGDVSSEALKQIYYGPPYNLGNQLNAFIEFTDQFLVYSAMDKSARREKLHKFISREYSDKILPGLDAALANYQREAIEKIQRYFQIQFYMTVFILIVLVIEAYYIFRPLVKSIKKYHNMLSRHANEDELTGLNNRRAFMTMAQEALKAAQENRKEVAFALLDLDKFKSVNDTYGHDIGDKVLVHFAKLLKNELRPQDVIGRIGGEEFALVLTETGQNDAMKTLERLRKRIEKTPLSL